MLNLTARITSVAAAALVALSLTTPGASAAQRSCEKPGYAVASKDATNVVLKRKSPNPGWEGGLFRVYVCSRSYGRLVSLGDDGMTPDGPEWVSIYAMNARYVAAGGGWAGNADVENDFGVGVIDLKTGRPVSSSGVSDGSKPDGNIVNATLNSRGDAGWIYGFWVGGGSMNYQVYLLRATGPKKLQRLSESAAIDPGFVGWSTDQRRLIWADPARSVEYTPRVAPKASVIEHGRCIRRGEAIVGRGFGYVFTSRRPARSRWPKARELIGCSLTYKRRVVLGRVDEIAGHRFFYQRPVGSGRYAALVTLDVANGVTRRTITSFDLGLGRKICSADASAGLANSTELKIALDAEGTLAWVSRGFLPVADSDSTAQSAVRVSVCAGTSPAVIADDPGIRGKSVHFGASGIPTKLLYTIETQNSP